MLAIETLRREHLWIRSLLECLEKVAVEAQSEGHLASPRAAELVSLLGLFADGVHQRKEEQVLFPNLLKHVAIEERLYLGRLFGDHERGRHELRGLHASLLGAIYGEPLSVREFVLRAQSYVESHRRHMAHEEAILFPMAQRVLGREDDQRITDGFHGLELRAPRHAEFAGRLVRLCESFGVAVEAAQACEEPSGPGA